jgi:predicted dehydrogenase
MTTPIRLIIVGLGARAQFWMRVINASPDVTIVGLVDPTEAARSRALAQCLGAVADADLKTVIDKVSADAVLLCTPPGSRETQMALCCDAKLAILAEKPLADSVELAQKYVEMAENAGVPLMVGLNFRYLDVTRATLKLFEEEVGAPSYARFTYERWRDGHMPYLNKYPLAMEQPMLWEQSIHHFDLLRYVYRSEAVAVYAKAFNPPWSMYAHEANVSAMITFENGVIVNYQGTWAANWQEPHFEWRSECANGIVSQKDQFGDLTYARLADEALTKVDLPPYERWINDAIAMLAAFVAGLRGEQPLECTGRDHLKSLRIIQACILSSETGQAINPSDLE